MKPLRAKVVPLRKVLLYSSTTTTLAQKGTTLTHKGTTLL